MGSQGRLSVTNQTPVTTPAGQSNAPVPVSLVQQQMAKSVPNAQVTAQSFNNTIDLTDEEDPKRVTNASAVNNFPPALVAIPSQNAQKQGPSNKVTYLTLKQASPQMQATAQPTRISVQKIGNQYS